MTLEKGEWDMLGKANGTKVLMGVLTLTLLAVPQLSYADWSIGIGIGDRHDDRDFHRDDHRFYRYHDHPHWGLHIHFLPAGYYTIWAGGVRYYYYDGLYYRYVGNGDYVIVEPPTGAVVTGIPSDFQPVIINGGTYYANNGIYYVYTRHGYRVVAAPVTVVQPAVVQAPPVIPAPVAQDTFMVNVPNNNGGYTTVVIKKSGNGFVGPQGEFYSQFPTVAQLRVMYGK